MVKIKQIIMLLTLLLSCSLGAHAQQPLDVTFDFSNKYGLSTVGLATSISGVNNINGKTATNNGVSITMGNSGGNIGLVHPVTGSNKFLCLKSGADITISAPVSYEITSASFTYSTNKGSWTVDGGSFDGTTWTGSQNAINFKTSSEARIKTITLKLVEVVLPPCDVQVTNAYDFSNMMVGGSQEVIFNPSGMSISATSNDFAVARYENGRIVAYGVGETTFDFYSAANASYDTGHTTLFVKVLPVTLEMENASALLSLMVEDELVPEFNLTGRTYSAEGYDSNIVKYENGKVIAVGEGETNITFRSSINGLNDGGVLTVPVKVAPYQPLHVTYDFKNNTGYGASTILTHGTVPSGVNTCDGMTITRGTANVKVAKNSGKYPALVKNNHLWLRADNSLLFTAPEGYVITNITFNYDGSAASWNANSGEIAGGAWNGDSEYVVLTSTSDVNIISATVNSRKFIPKVLVGDFEYAEQLDYYLTVAPGTSISVKAQDIADSSIFYNLVNEKLLNTVATNQPVENNIVDLSESGKWMYEFYAYNAAMEQQAVARLHVIVKDNEAQLENGIHTLDFQQFHYGMPDNDYASLTHHFTGVDTNGIDFFIPQGENIKHVRGSHLEMEPSSSFQVGLDHHGRAFTTVTISGEELDNLVIAVGGVELPLDANGSVSFRVIDSNVKSFTVKHKGNVAPSGAPRRLAAAAGNVAIKNMTMSSDISTGVEALESAEEAVIYDMNGRRVNGEELLPGLYIKREGSKTVKILVK